MNSVNFQNPTKKSMKQNIFIVSLIGLITPIHSFSSKSPNQKSAFLKRQNPVKTIPIVEEVSEVPYVQPDLSTTQLAIAGALAAIVGDVSLHPIDCIKTIQQSDIGLGMNLFDTSEYIFDNFGIWGFFNGLAPYVTGDCFGSAFKLSSYESFKRWVYKHLPSDLEGAALYVCAGLSFLIAASVVVPGELIKQRMQMGQITSIIDGITSIYESEGISGLYTGFSGVCVRDVPYTMLELGLYDNLKRTCLQFKDRGTNGDMSEITQTDEIIAAALTGGIAGYLTAPFDVIKTKLMVDHDMYNGFIDCTMKTIHNHGIESLFQGGVARIIWLVPFTAIYLPCYDLIKRAMQKRNMKSN